MIADFIKYDEAGLFHVNQLLLVILASDVLDRIADSELRLVNKKEILREKKSPDQSFPSE